MADFDEKIAQVFADGDARRAKIESLLPTSDDLVGLVLRGHLLVEELLFSSCAAFCRDAEQLKGARLRFPQLVSLLRALEKIPAVPPDYWAALLELNSFRNALAHQLEHKDIEGRISRFVSAVRLAAADTQLPVPANSHEAVKTALHFLIGGLEVVSVWHASVEELLRARALESRNGAAA